MPSLSVGKSANGRLTKRPVRAFAFSGLSVHSHRTPTPHRLHGSLFVGQRDRHLFQRHLI